MIYLMISLTWCQKYLELVFFYFWIKIRILEGNFWIEKSQFWLWEIHKRTSALNTDCNRCWFSRYPFTSTTVFPIVSFYRLWFLGIFGEVVNIYGPGSGIDSWLVFYYFKSKVSKNRSISVRVMKVLTAYCAHQHEIQKHQNDFQQ